MSNDQDTTAPGKVGITIKRVEVHADDPDRLVHKDDVPWWEQRSAELKRWLPVCVWLKGGLSFAEWCGLSEDDKVIVIGFCNAMAGPL